MASLELRTITIPIPHTISTTNLRDATTWVQMVEQTLSCSNFDEYKLEVKYDNYQMPIEIKVEFSSNDDAVQFRLMQH